MNRSLRSGLWMLFAASLLGGSAVAFAQAGAPTPAGAAAPAAGAVAQPPAGAPGRRSLIGAKCKDDAAKLCANVPPGGGKLAACLRSHEAELSEACKGALPPGRGGAMAPGGAAGGASGMAAPGAAGPHGGPMGGMKGKEWGPMKGMHKACGADVDKFCKDVAPGHGRIAVCLNEHAGDLSPACKPVAQDIAAKMNEPMQMHEECSADVQKLCSDVPAGSGRIGYCLGEHSAELSAPCKKHIDEMKAHWGKGGKMHGKGDMMGHPGGMMMGHPGGMMMGAGGHPGAAAPAAPAMK